MHKHTHVLLNIFTFPKCEEEDCGKQQFSKGILPPTERAGMTERQGGGSWGGWFGGFGERGRMFSTGNMNRWRELGNRGGLVMGLIERRRFGGLNMPAERSTGFFQKETPSHASSPPTLHLSLPFSHTAMPSSHGCIVGKKKKEWKRDKSAFLNKNCPCPSWISHH